MYKITLKLQQMRNLKHMTQKRLAFLANISQGHISELETGNKSPTLKTVEGLASALKTSPCDLLEVSTSKNENKIRLNWKRLEK